MTAPDTRPSPDSLASTGAEIAWQRRLLPFMVGFLAVAAVAFIASTLWFFHDLQGRLEFESTEIVDSVVTLPVGSKLLDQSYRDWLVRVRLEERALKQRFQVQANVVQARLWTRFMGFLTGMLLALTGCVFVLGKLRESVDFTAKGGAAETTLATTSPGVFLALLGTIIIGISLTGKITAELSDTAVYVRDKESISAHEERADPAPLNSDNTAAVSGGDNPLMPDSVRAQIARDATGTPDNTETPYSDKGDK